MEKLNKISVFGTCATIDNIKDIKGVLLETKTVISRQTLVSSGAPPVPWIFKMLILVKCMEKEQFNTILRKMLLIYF